MTTAEIKDLLDQLAAAGVFFLVFSGGEVFLRRDFFELLEHARSLLFSVKVKTNAIMIGEKEADRLAELGLHGVQVSVYSHRPEVHDRITKVPGSLERTLAGARLLRERGVNVIFANVLMGPNAADYPAVRSLALVYASKSSSISGSTRRSSRKCAPSAWPIYRDAPNASTPAHARVAPGWLIWRAICAGRRSRIARNPSPEPEFPRKICSRSIPSWSKSPISTRLHLSQLKVRSTSAQIHLEVEPTAPSAPRLRSLRGI